MKEITTMHHEGVNKVVLGFWIYLMTDLLMFAVMFAAYIVLRENVFGGPPGKELFDLPFALIETMILLTSSFTCGLGMLFARRNKVRQTLVFFFLTFALGVSFLGMELYEFNHLIHEGNTPQRSAFLSSFFTLVGTHGIHITAGLLWLLILLIYILRRGLNASAMRKLTLLSLFWHFLDIVWIFIFTIVYLFAKII